jgi:hypothetical protein
MYGETSGGGGGGAGLLIAYFIVVWLLSALPLWFVFKKAGKAPWAALIPIYNWIVLLEVVGRPIWWILLLVIPCVNIFVFVIVANDLAKSFGQGIGFTIGLIFLPFIFGLILGLGSYRYLGPAGAPGGLPPAQVA